MTNTSLYSNLLDPIDIKTWKAKISATAKGTACGLSGETIDMLAAIDDDSSKLLVRVLNLMLRGRRAFSAWLHRAICPIPKIPGNPDVALSRPLTLLSVSGKIFWGILTNRITKI